MKITRQKRVQRYLNFYVNNFGFRPPYLILLDGTFCNEALKYKINIREQLPKYFNAEVRILTTTCLVHEVENLSTVVKSLYGAMLVLKHFEAQKCGHEKNPVPGAECLMSMINSPDCHYIIGTQDAELASKVRATPGIPLLYINFNAIILEKPSECSVDESNKRADEKVQLTDHQKTVLDELKKQTFGESSKPVKRKKKKGPNPLSCLKKKCKTSAQGDSTPKAKKTGHRRNRKKVAKHVKEHFKTLNQSI